MKKLSTLAALSLPAWASAQDQSIMYSNDKIFVVVGVIVIIFALLGVYLVNLDRKIKKLEDEK
jgi:CcmD family protein